VHTPSHARPAQRADGLGSSVGHKQVFEMQLFPTGHGMVSVHWGLTSWSVLHTFGVPLQATKRLSINLQSVTLVHG
jgi:hypothetical protein